jgi:pimeloyl-ACP methyl ester carboxylesterase/lysophospholipase L1-like esterase
MILRTIVACALTIALSSTNAPASDSPASAVSTNQAAASTVLTDVSQSSWFGFNQLQFVVDGRNCLLVIPKDRAVGRPWIWRTEFFGHEPQADLALLSNGWHVAYMDVQNLYGAPAGLDHMDRFYEDLTNRFQLSPRAVLEGFSRGGLFAFNWAARHPDRVAGLYVDAPVCDFKSWPAGWGKGKGSTPDWERCKQVYGLNDNQARQYPLNPVDNLEPLARARIPILSVCGDADDIVPIAENTLLVQERYQKLGGIIKVISKSGVGHHPHSLQDPQPIVDFLLQQALYARAEALFPPQVKRVLFLGDSITYSGHYVAHIATYYRLRFPDRKIEFLNLGLPSETLSGLSEPDHLRHGFPRPDLHERLARVLAKTKPDLVFSCYGMNDGIYLPFDQERFGKFQQGIDWLRTQITQSGAKLILMTPPVYDEIKGGQQGYAEVLDRYSDWLVQQRARGWEVVDLHTPMKQHLAQQRERDPAFTFAGDGIHPDNLGHWLMARSVLSHLGARDVARAQSIEDLLAGFPNGETVLAEEAQQLARWRDAWLTATGHKRPGLAPGRPIEIDPKTGAAHWLPKSSVPNESPEAKAEK